MRTYSLLILLSFLTIPLSLNSQLLAYGSATPQDPATSHQWLAAQTQIGKPSPPDPGRKRRTFN